MSSSHQINRSATRRLFSTARLCPVAAALLIGSFSFGANAHGQSRNGSNSARGAQSSITETATPDLSRKGVLKVNQSGRAIPDFMVLDQDGRRLRFYTDLIKGKVVVLSFFYTECSFVCDGQGRNFARLQRLLGDRLGRDVFFISVTRTPMTDTPAKLKSWAKRYRVGRGWTLVTGRTPDIARLVGTFARDNLGPQEMHSAPILIGNEATGSWLSSSGLSSPEQIAELINKVSAR